MFAQSLTKRAIRPGSAANTHRKPSHALSSQEIRRGSLHRTRSQCRTGRTGAGADRIIEGVLQNIVTMLTGNVARLLATLAVIIVGIAWMFGYLDLRKAAYVVLGVAITFGASEVVSTLTGGH